MTSIGTGAGPGVVAIPGIGNRAKRVIGNGIFRLQTEPFGKVGDRFVVIAVVKVGFAAGIMIDAWSLFRRAE